MLEKTYLPFEIPPKTGAFRTMSHFIKDGNLYVSSSCVSDSSISEFEFDVYDIDLGYTYVNTVNLSRSDPDKVDDAVYFSECSGGWGAKTEYTNDIEYAINAHVQYMLALFFVLLVWGIFGLYLRKWWRRT